MSQPEKISPGLGYESYISVALQPKTYGCRNKEDVRKNLDHLTQLIDDTMYTAWLGGASPVKLVTIPEGGIQGFWDEMSNMDQADYCKNVAITIPGPETDRLAEKAKKHEIYIAAQAKVSDPDLMPDRFFNMGFIISPEGEIILKHTKNIISVIEGSTSPYDIWDRWVEKKGDNLEAFYPVVKTDIGNLAIAICAEASFPETFRAFSVMGAEVIIKMTMAEPFISTGYWEYTNRTRAFDNMCYIVAPNLGPYYTNPDLGETYSVCGGNSMIVDYKGEIVTKADHGNVGSVPGEIFLKNLRQYRTEAPIGLTLAQMRPGLWKQIYEKWPDYPKNLYLEKTYPKAEDRMLLLWEEQHLGKLVAMGIHEPAD